VVVVEVVVVNFVSLKTKISLPYIGTQSVPRSKHSPPRLYKTIQLVLYKPPVALCAEIHMLHTIAMLEPCRVFGKLHFVVSKVTALLLESNTP